MLLFVSYLFNVIDYFFTSKWVKIYGIEIEANPIGRWMFSNNSAFIIKIFVVGALFILLWFLLKKSRRARKIKYLIFAVYSFVTVYHLLIYMYLI